MEDLKKRLHYPSRDIQLAAANKLFTQISSTKKVSSPDSPIGEKQSQIPELSLLFEIIQDGGTSASTLCCQTIVALVNHGLLDFKFALNKFLNFIPTAKHGRALVHSITDLLLLQVMFRQTLAPEEAAEVLYSLRSPPHPFISVFVSKSTLWPDILQEISRLLKNADSSLSTECWDMMKPFFIYVLQDPLSAGHTSHLKFSLVSELISICQHNSEMTEHVMTFLVVECFPCLQLKSKMAIQESFTLLGMATSWFLSCDVTTKRHFLEAVTLDLLLISHQLSVLGEGLYPALTLIKKVCFKDVGFLPGITLLVISGLLLRGCSLEEQSILLELAESVVLRSTNLWFVSTMILPLLQILSHQKSQVTMEAKLLSSNQKLATRIMSKISEIKPHEGKLGQKIKGSEKSRISILSHFYILQCCHQLLESFHQPSCIYAWLTSVQQNLQQYPSNSLQIPEYILLLATTLFVQSKHHEELCLQTLLDLVTRDNSKATSILTLFLYKLSQKDLSTSLTKELMYAIPELAHHKFSLAPVLKVVQSMAGAPALAPVGMRLAAKVWMKQERCFPQLQAMISRTDKVDKGTSVVYDEFLLARVATVRDICVARPHQHGAELIPTLSKILNDCTGPSEATAAALAMDALTTLSEEEVVDIRTIWQVLEPKLSKDSRSKVQESICHLFSLVPELAVDTEEYEEFRERVVTLLWQRTHYASPQVVKAAYSALAQFDKEDFYLQDLPEQVVLEVKGQTTHATGEDEDDGEEETEDVPGPCFISLLKTLPEAAQTGFEKLLSSLVSQEIASLPRHLNFTVTQKEAQSSSQADKFINTIPLLVYNRFETNKQPALKAPIAVSLLFCYEPKAEKGRDSRHGKRQLLSREQHYLNMLRILLNEIPSSYYFELPHLMSLSAAWVSFMGKVFQASLESQLAQVETQEEDKEPSAASLTAWLHVRDKLFGQVKNISRESSSAHPNCLLALAALAVVVTQHYLSLGKDTANIATLAPERVSQPRWVRQVVESLLLVIDSSYRADERIFSWCQKGLRQQGVTKQNSYMVAALGLSQIAPVLIAMDTELILRIMSVMDPLIGTGKNSTDETESDSSTTIPGVAVGLLLNGITEEKFIEVVGNEALTKVVTLLNHLEETAFSSGAESNGAMLGLGEALSAMASDSAVPIQSQMTNIIQKLTQKLGEDVKSKEGLQISAYTLSMLIAASFNSNIIDAEEAEASLKKLEDLSRENNGIATSLGFLCHSLCQGSHPRAHIVTMATIEKWTETLEKQESSSVDKIDAINGLVAFISGPSNFVRSSLTSNFNSEIDQEMLQIIKKTQQMFLDSQDLRTQTSLVTWLGYLSFVKASSSQVRRAVPANYDYLSEESLLRACVDFLQTAAQLGPEEVSAWKVEVVFAALTGDGTSRLPPVNWAALIGPLLRLSFGGRVQYRLIRLALSQCPSSHNASLFLSPWLSSSFFYNSLESQSKELLHVSLPTLAQHVPYTKLKDYLHSSLLIDLKGGNAKVQVQIIKGLLGALKLPEPPPSIMSLLYEFTEKIYDCLSEEALLGNDVLFRLVAECLVYLPPEMIDVISHPAQQGNLVKSTLLRSYLIGCGKQSLAWLEVCIDMGMNLATDKEHYCLILALSRGLLQCSGNSTSAYTRVTSRMQWLVEFIGHTHNVTSGKTQLKKGRSTSQAAKFLLDLFCSVVAVWCSNQIPVLVGVSPFTQIEVPDDPTESIKMDDPESPSSCLRDEDVIIGRCVELLPESMVQLLDKQPWNQITEKILQWLIAMHKLPAENIPLKYHVSIKATCQALRHHAEFKKQIWTTVYTW